jgi:dienelactone hydrolase
MTHPDAPGAGRTCPLPPPTGPRQVGRHLHDFVDHRRHDIYAPRPGAPRELSLCLWYPAQPAADADRSTAPYLPPAWQPVADALGVRAEHLDSHAATDAPLSTEQNQYPVVLLSPSGFTAFVMAALAEELASHGFVVVGVNHTYEAPVTVFSDGRVAPMNPAATAGVLGRASGSHEEAFGRRAAVCLYKAADLLAVADHLSTLRDHPLQLDRDHLDVEAVAAVGHSFGGNAALEWCVADRRCRSAVNLDGAIWTDVATRAIPKPVLQVLADHPELELPPAQALAAGVAPDLAWYQAEQRVVFEGWRSVHRLAQPGATAHLAGATHTSFMDVPFLPVATDSPLRHLPDPAIEPSRVWRITSDLLATFLARHLLGHSGASLDRVMGARPEVTNSPPAPPTEQTRT